MKLILSVRDEMLFPEGMSQSTCLIGVACLDRRLSPVGFCGQLGNTSYFS